MKMDIIEGQPERSQPLHFAEQGDAAVSISTGLRRLERVLQAYGKDDDESGATAQVLLSEIESLRRYVLVPGQLKAELNAAKAPTGEPLGQRLGAELFSMIKRIKGRAFVMTRAERLALDRTSRRAIGCLSFLGSIDTRYMRQDGAH